MRWWIKALAIGVAVIVVLSVMSAVLHVLRLALLAVVIGAVVVAALKAREMLRGRREGREVKSGGRQPEASQASATPRQLAAPAQVDARAKAVQLQDDVDAELARLKREME